MTPGTLWVLDRIEDHDTAVLLSPEGKERLVPVEQLPEGAMEGAALREVGLEESSAPGNFILDEEATERRRREARALRDSLRKGPSGPLSL